MEEQLLALPHWEGSFSLFILFDNGANPNLARNDGKTPLLAPSHNGHNNIIQLLLERNISLNTQNEDQWTEWEYLPPKIFFLDHFTNSVGIFLAFSLYVGKVFYEEKQGYEWLIRFLVTWDLIVLHEVYI